MDKDSKLIVTERICSINDLQELLVGELEDVIEKVVTRLKSFRSPSFQRVVLTDETGWDSPTSICVYGEREETDEEYTTRMDQNTRRENAKREKDLKLLAELKTKYEKEK